MTLAVSLDLETLSTHKNAVILTIGATTISLDGSPERTFTASLDAQVQIDAGMHVSASTLKWWMRQDPKVQRDAFDGDDTHPVLAIEMLRGWLKAEGWPPVWTKGPHFDGALLDSLAEAFGVDAPIPYRKHRDIRTIEEAFESYAKDERLLERYYTMKERAYSGIDQHNALADAIAQGEVVRFWLKELQGV